MRIWKEFAFEAAHRLPNLPAEHKCARLHGHSYRFRLNVEGPVDPTTGWVVDFGGLLKAAGDLILSLVDHRYLNEIDGLANPTAELLACWIWDRVRLTQLPLVAVEVFETCTTGVYYEGPPRRQRAKHDPTATYDATAVIMGVRPPDEDGEDE